MTDRILARAGAALALALAASPAAAAATTHAYRCGTGVDDAQSRGFVWFPEGDVFCPLVADPKAVGSFLSYVRGKFPAYASPGDFASIGVGDGFAFFRVGGPAEGDGVQLGIEAAVFAQFALDTRSRDLVNADYVVGFPLTFRRAGFSVRARVYHQSSHLGDEYLLHSGVQREEISLESAELLLSQELGPFRIYGGGEYAFDRTPSAIAREVGHGGAELRIGPSDGVRLVAAADLKTTEFRRWSPAWSARAGLEFAIRNAPGEPARVWSILAEWYDGPSPYGQFFLDHTRYYGVGAHFQL